MKSFTLHDFTPSFLRPRHAITVSQGESGAGALRLAARRGETLFSVLRKNQIAIASSCGGGGACGQCVVEIADAGDQKDVSEADNRHLTKDEVRHGRRLACQKRVVADLSVNIPGLGPFTEAMVLANREISEGMREIVLRLPARERHIAGQYRCIKVPPYRLDVSEYRAATGDDRARPFVNRRQEIRSYSMSAPSGDGESVASFIVRKMPPLKRNAPPGVGATYVCSRRPGDIVHISGPRGAFRVRDGHDRLVMIGGGAGMAPLRAMILDLLTVRDHARPISFYYGARAEADLIYREEFENLAARHKNFIFECAVSDGRRAEGRWPMCHVHELAERRLNEAGATEGVDGTGFYLCGPPPMLAAATKMLQKFGAASEQIFIDDFGI